MSYNNAIYIKVLLWRPLGRMKKVKGPPVAPGPRLDPPNHFPTAVYIWQSFIEASDCQPAVSFQSPNKKCCQFLPVVVSSPTPSHSFRLYLFSTGTDQFPEPVFSIWLPCAWISFVFLCRSFSEYRWLSASGLKCHTGSISCSKTSWRKSWSAEGSRAVAGGGYWRKGSVLCLISVPLIFSLRRVTWKSNENLHVSQSCWVCHQTRK